MNLPFVQEAGLVEESEIQRVRQPDILGIGKWLLRGIVGTVDLRNKEQLPTDGNCLCLIVGGWAGRRLGGGWQDRQGAAFWKWLSVKLDL